MSPTDNAEVLSDQSFSVLVRQALRGFTRLLAADLAPHGVSVAEWSVLRFLWQEEGMTQVALADRIGVQKAALTTTLNEMEAKGYLDRNRNARDRRQMELRLTGHGRALKAVLLPYGVKNNRIATRGLSATEIEVGVRVLQQLIANLEHPTE